MGGHTPTSEDFGKGDPNGTQSSNLCADDGASLQCAAGFGVHVQGMLCGDGAQQCSPTLLGLVRRLCQGQRSCGGLGLRDIFTAHCHSVHPRARRVVVRFSCRQASEPQPPCRTNLCSNATTGLSCPAHSVLHVRNLTCQAGMVTCSPPTFFTLYMLCEGRSQCDASGLRLLPPLSTYCGQSSPPEFTNVFVDYLCVPDHLVRTQCTGKQYQSLTEPFGVLMNPGFAERTLSTGTQQCSWVLTPQDQGRQVHVLVHMADSKWNDDNCSANFLQVRFKDCESSESVTRKFCDLHQVNRPVTSCGPVHVSSWLPSASDQADHFLVSYQMVQKGSNPGTPAGMSVCSTTLSTPPPIPLTTRPTMDRRNYGPGGTMFDYSDTIRHTGEDEETDDHPAEGTVQLRLIILYVFFGVVIIALIIALVYVLISYRGISRRGGDAQGDSSEKAALWRHDDTPMDTFNTNSHASLSDAATSNPHTTCTTPETVHTPLTPDSQVVACTVHATESMPDNTRNSSGSRFSSFLPGKESEQHSGLAIVSPSGSDTVPGGSLPRRWSGAGMSRSSTRSGSFKMNGELGNIYETIDAQDHGHLHFSHHDGGEETPLVPNSSPLPPPAPLPLAMGYDPSYVEHYMVNDDEYALVRKPKSPKGRGGSQTSSPTSPSPQYANHARARPERRGDSVEGPDPTYDSVNIFRDKTGPVVGFRPTSGPYDRDRNSRSEPVSPSSGGTSRHRWDEL